MTRSRALVQASDDRTIPTEHQGTIPPNYYCRGWNAKRSKYCRSRAGHKTTHPRVGRCSIHGGTKKGKDKRVTHGQRSTVIGGKLADRIAVFAADPAPLDMLPTLARAKALLEESLEKYDGIEQVGPIVQCLEMTSKVAYRIEQIRAHGTVSYDRIRLFLLALDRAVDQVVIDQGMKAKLRREIHGIRV